MHGKTFINKTLVVLLISKGKDSCHGQAKTAPGTGRSCESPFFAVGWGQGANPIALSGNAGALHQAFITRVQRLKSPGLITKCWAPPAPLKPPSRLLCRWVAGFFFCNREINRLGGKEKKGISINIHFGLRILFFLLFFFFSLSSPLCGVTKTDEWSSNLQ